MREAGPDSVARIVLLGLLALAATGALPAAAAGGRVDISLPYTTTITVPFDDFAAFAFPRDVDVNIVINVTAGTEVDVYLMSQAWYNTYINPNSTSSLGPRTYSEDRVLRYNRTISDGTMTILVIDNAAFASSGAMPTGPVEVDLRMRVPPTPPPPPPPPPKPFDWNVLIFCGIPLLLFGVAMVFIIRSALRNRARQKREAELAAQQQAALMRADAGPPGRQSP